MTELLSNTMKYSSRKHREVNHKYDGKPYSFHLNMVYEVSLKFSYLLKEEDKENVYCGCWVHDLIEDTRETYTDVLESTNYTISELCYSLTNEKGKTRGERGNDKYYKEMHDVPNGVFIKLCDRISNVTYSIENGSKKLLMYRKENENFVKKLFRPELKDMFDYLEGLLSENK